MIPDTYRLLSAFSHTPLSPVAALERSLVRPLPVQEPLGRCELTDPERALLRHLVDAGWIRWISARDNSSRWTTRRTSRQSDLTCTALEDGYVLTEYGETRLNVWFEHYGPAHPLRLGAPTVGAALRSRPTQDGA